MERYLIILDLDGTTLKSDKTIDEQTVQAIKKVNKLGHVVVIATGRSFMSSLKYYHQLELNTFMITRNGAFVYSPISHQTMMWVEIPKNTITQLLNDTICDDVTELYLESKKDTYCLKGNKEKKPIMDLKNITQVTTCSFIIQKEKLDKVLSVLDSLSTIKYDYWKYGEQLIIIEIYPKSADKSISLGYLADYYHISHKNIIAIGDGNNDIKLFQNASLGIAVKNASERLKKVSSKVLTYTNNDGAVRQFLTEYFKLA